MKYLKLRQSLHKIGVNTRFSIDIVSVAERVRDFGLLHIEAYKKDKTIKLLNENNCKVIASRDLKFLKDSESREGMLYDVKEQETPTHCEIWYSHIAKEIEPNFNPFSNPGKFLGYPKCCFTKYENTYGMGEFYKEYLFPDNRMSRYNEINRLCTLFNSNLLMPDFFPCSLSCIPAYEFGVQIQSIIDLIYSKEETEDTFKYKLSPLIIISDKLYCFPNFKIEFDKLTLKLGSSSQFVNLSSVLDKKYWPAINGRNLLINFKNIEKTKKLFIEYNHKIEELKFDLI
jgi:hypothetical protein